MSEEQLSDALYQICAFIQIDIEDEEIDLLDPSILSAVLTKLFPSKIKHFIERPTKVKIQNKQWQAIVKLIESEILQGQQFDFQQFSQHQIIQLYIIVADYLNYAMELQEKRMPEKQKAQNVGKSDQKPGQSKQQYGMKRQSQSKTPYQKKKKIIQEPKRPLAKKNIHIQDVLMNEKHKNQSKGESKSKSKSKNKSKSQSKQKKSQPKLSKKAIKDVKTVQQPLQQQLTNEVKKVVQGKKLRNKSTKTNVLFRDEKSLEAVKAAKRKFNYYLNEFKNSKTKATGKSENKLNKQKDQVFLKGLEKKHKSIEEDIINQQIKYFLTLRDRKVAFINKVHRLTERLQRERLVDWTHQQRQVMLDERQKVKKRIEKADTLFDKNMEILRDQYKEMKDNKAKMQVDQHVVCHQLQKAVAKRKYEEIQLLKTLWQQQNSKLTNIIGDQQKVKNKLIDIYRKHRP